MKKTSFRGRKFRDFKYFGVSHWFIINIKENQNENLAI